MKAYEWILFDADDTLFKFDSFAGLKILFARFGIDFTQTDYQDYQVINKNVWDGYHQGTTTMAEIKQKRFEKWASKLHLMPEELNGLFLDIMADIAVLIDGAADLLKFLYGKAKLGIVTNGMSQLHYARLKQTATTDYFDVMVVSEEVGYAKPHAEIFNYAMAEMKYPNRDKVLMVGDNLDTDILGAVNFGLDSCWFNLNNTSPAKDAIKPKLQVATLSELENILSLGFRG